MDDQSHIFQLLFQEQIDDYKQSLSSIDDLFEQKKEQPVTVTESIDYLFEKGDFLSDENRKGPSTSSGSSSSSGSSPSSKEFSGFIIDEVDDFGRPKADVVLSLEQTEETEEIQDSKRASFSCNGTSELPLHIQDVRERVKRELGSFHNSDLYTTAAKLKDNTRVTTNLHLTDEERKLLVEEGVSLPEDLPLTKAEERVLKKVRRKIRNKRSAMESRRRKKEYISTVEEKYESSKDENDELKKRVNFLEKQNRDLMKQLRRLQESVMAAKDRIQIPKSGHACALGVVLFSLFVFCYPGGSGPLMFETQENFEVLQGFKSRKILQVDATGLDYDYFEMGSQMQNNETTESPENLTIPNQEDIEKPILNPIVPASGSAGIIYEQNSEILPVARHKSLMPESPEEYIKSISRQGEM